MIWSRLKNSPLRFAVSVKVIYTKLGKSPTVIMYLEEVLLAA